MDIYEVMRTTFAAREFTDAVVSDEVLRAILDQARFAPSGGNRQGWRVVVVRSDETKSALASLITPTVKRYMAQMMAGESPWNTIEPTKLSQVQIDETEVPPFFHQTITGAPVVLIVLVDLSVVASFDAQLDRVGVISGASVYPFAWNILLAARNEGLGGTLTTFVAAEEQQVRSLLDVPDHMAVAALLPIGEPVKQLTRLSRKPVDEFTTCESYNGPQLGGDHREQ